LLIEANLKETDAEKFASSKQDMQNGYIWYTLPEEQVNNTNVIFSLCYHLNKLERAKDTEQFLRSLGYPPNKYKWGEIWSIVDSKGGFAKGGIRYNK